MKGNNSDIDMSVLRCILLFFLFFMTTMARRQTGECVIVETKFLCTGDIPAIVPDSVTEVHVKDYNKESINGSVFQDKSWFFIDTLHIHVYERIPFDAIGDFTFSMLSGLRSLKLNSVHLNDLKKHTFAGLDNLKLLDLSGCASLRIEEIVSALNDTTIAPAIDTLLLDEVGSGDRNWYLHLEQGFIYMIIAKHINKLSLARTNLYVNLEKYTQDDLLPVKELNLSHANLYAKKIQDGRLLFVHLFRNLRILDISGHELRAVRYHTKGNITYFACGSRVHFYLRLERLYANNMVTFTKIMFNGTNVNATSCPVNLRLLHMRSSKISIVNGSFFWPMKAPKVDIDLSDNTMEYFNIKGHVPVFKLNLSRNSLFQMELHNEFVDTFTAFPNLEELMLNYNGLRRLPRDIFLHNPRLIKLSIQGNRLTTLSFDFGHLHNLRLLNIKENSIEYINDNALSVIGNLQAKQHNQNNTSIIEIDFRHNQIDCSCKNYVFIRWLWGKRERYASPVYDVRCSLGDQRTHQIDEETVGEVEFLCKRTAIIIVSSSITIFGLVVSFGAILICRLRDKKRKRKRFVERFQKRKTKERFLALISHSKTDSDVVYTSVRFRLEDEIRKVVPVEFDLISLGDIHFRPGMAIVNEIHRLVSESCVAIFLISRAFLESGYCQCEMKEAYAQNKPIILMFLEEVDEQAMTPLMQSIFRNFSRVKVTVENDNVEMAPSWDNLTQSIINLAVNQGARNSIPNCWMAIVPRGYRLVRQN